METENKNDSPATQGEEPKAIYVLPNEYNRRADTETDDPRVKRFRGVTQYTDIPSMNVFDADADDVDEMGMGNSSAFLLGAAPCHLAAGCDSHAIVLRVANSVPILYTFSDKETAVEMLDNLLTVVESLKDQVEYLGDEDEGGQE